MFNKHDLRRNQFMLKGGFARKGYDWWWHSFTAISEKTGEEKPFYVEFFVCNPKRGKDYPIFGQLKENQEKGIFPSYLMVNVGCWCPSVGGIKGQFHRFFGINEVEINKGVPYSIKAGDCFLTETKTYGKVEVTMDEVKRHPEYMSDSGVMEWNLSIDKKIAYNVGYGAGSLFRSLQAFEMFWHAEGMKSEYSGEVILNGEKYIVNKERSFGYADKNWGRDFTSPWVWLSSCNLTSKMTGRKLDNSVFDIGGGRPKVGFIALKRKLLSAFFYEGKCYEFNFSKFWTNTKTLFKCDETDREIIWHVEQKTWRNKMVTDIRCKKSDMILINYEAPNGKKLHNHLWNGGSGFGVVKLYHKKKLVDEIECKNVGCEYGEYDK